MSQLPFPAFFDSSMIACYKECPAKFWRTYIQQWKSKLPNVHLHAGGAFAAGLERTRRSFWENHCDAETSIAHGLQTLMERYGDFQCPSDSAKSLERTAGAFEFYWSNYPLEDDRSGEPILLPGGGRGIEFSFAHPLPVAHPDSGDPILYCGRMDAIINYAGGVYICDEKTTSSLGASWGGQWDLRSQFTGYAWGCRESGIEVNGAIVRGVSILKTKYETQQAIVGQPQWKIDRWVHEIEHWIQRIGSDWASQRWLHNLDSSCSSYGGCAFRRVCDSNLNQESELETSFEKRFWNPLDRTETKL